MTLYPYCLVKKKLQLSTLLIFIYFISFSQAKIEWQKSFGGSKDDIAYSIQQTTDSGFVVAGKTKSSNGAVSENHGDYDFWIIKMDQNSSIIWQKSFGGSGADIANSVQQTKDGGFIVAGSTNSTDGDISESFGSIDFWILKLSAEGSVIWEKSLGGTGSDDARSIQQTTDDGYIVAGSSSILNQNRGYEDENQYRIAKLSSTGEIVWDKLLGGSSRDVANCIQQTNDGGYIVAGSSMSFNGDVVSTNHGSFDWWIVKLNSTGDIVWEKAYGGTKSDIAKSIQQTKDGGFIVAGSSFSTDGDLMENFGVSDYWVVKLDNEGRIMWQNSLGDIDHDGANSIKQTKDGGYIIAGAFSHPDGIINGQGYKMDFWIIKIDSMGSVTRSKYLGGESTDIPYSICQTFDGGYVAAGYSRSNTGDVTENQGNSDYWIVKFTTPKVLGRVYFDSNKNGTHDNNENGIDNIKLVVNPGNIIVHTQEGGKYWFESLPVGEYTVTIDTTGLWQPSSPSQQDFSISNLTADTNAPSFGMYNQNPCPEPDISIYSPRMRRCFDNQKIYISVRNSNTATGMIEAAYIDIELDTLFMPLSATRPFTKIDEGLYRFDIGNLNPGQSVDFNISTLLSCDARLQQTLCLKASLFPVNECVLDTLPTLPFPHGTGSEVILPAPCTLPWDKSSLSVEGWCQNDSVYFSVTNNGEIGGGDMECYSPVLVFVNDILTKVDSVMLPGQSTQYYSFAANGETWILNAEQHPLHPGNSHPNAHVEACGTTINNWIPDMVNNQPLDDADPVVDIYCGLVTGSYDPNDKTGFPSGIGDKHSILPNQQLQYVIRFQNTGTDTAFTVIIRDTLDTDLNIFTVVPGVSSHSNEFKMYGERVLEWTFNKISLPDSTSNEPESHGFVSFSVEQLPNLAEGTQITNSAGIYFDFNEPIITNQISYQIDYMIKSLPLRIQKISLQNRKSIKVYPNPTNGKIILETENPQNKLQYQILDISGRIVQSGFILQQHNQLDISNCSCGFYFIRVEGGNQVKIIKQ